MALAERIAQAVAPYGMEAATSRMRGILDRTFPPAPEPLLDAARAAGRPLHVVVASHDLKFFTRIADHLAGLPGVELRFDHWEALSVHDVSASEAAVAWADVVICEWDGPNLVWYSRHKRPGQRLITRLHRFELGAGWLADVRAEAIDQVVCVSPYYAQLTAERTGWDPRRIVVIPNWVDVDQFDRPKLSGAEGHALMNVCMAATYDPDPRTPLGFRLPFNLESGELIGPRWRRWQAHDPINLVRRHAANLRTLKGLYIDCGWKDQYHIHYGTRMLSRRLGEAGIRHAYEEFDDNHSDIDYRMNVSLPFLYRALAP
jgi:hypothetical protein